MSSQPNLNVTKATTTAERIVALMNQPSYDIHGMFIGPTKSYSPSALKKAMRNVPIAEIRKTLEDLCEQGVVKWCGWSFRMTSGGLDKREKIYTLNEPKESN
jgi:hypothetical protein